MPTDQATYDASVLNVETKKTALEAARNASNAATLTLRQANKDYQAAIDAHAKLVAPSAQG